ncbi:hypothetical protein, partial [Nocardia tenerifensis]|uniref:hypothetical protein n=1 Tax=Nocardia tenerifensis TaxID=228006 RepID=UPI000592E805
MGTTQTDRVMHQLRGDVDALYELSGKTNAEVAKTGSLVHGIDKRLQRLESTCGRQFGVLLATHRQHNHRMNRMESLLGEVSTQVNHLTPLHARVDEVAEQVGHLAPLPARVDELAQQVGHLAPLPARVDELAQQVGHL